ncbi:MAG: Uma2 family endonuclease [Acidobacteria bacterium]|nr:Uma2 family endonuclease [Acidobacteriota bacterium]
MSSTARISNEPGRKLCTREETRSLEDLGLFEGKRYELIEGELINKIGQKPPHAYAMQVAVELLAEIFGAGRVRCQMPVEVADEDRLHNEPEPDISVTREKPGAYRGSHPGGNDLLLLVEVADTSMRRDLKVKPGLYARAGVREYWVVSIKRASVIVHRSPESGKYTDVREYVAGDSVATLSSPTRQIAVSSLFSE